MAFEVAYRGAVIKADTAGDVRDLLVVLAQPLPRLLGAGEVPELPGVEDAGTRGRRAARGGRAGRRRPRRDPREGGGVPRKAPRRHGAAAARAEALRARVLELVVRDGVSVPADITRRAGATTFRVRQVLKELLASGALRGEGKTMSRRYYPADSRRPAKEGLR